VSNSIVIINVDTNISHAEIVKAAAALQRQVLEHFYPVWGVDATVRAATPQDPPRDDEWHFELRKVPTIEGALGFHDTTAAGLPRLFDFPELDAQDGVSWTVTASHEILEALADPWLRRGAQDDQGVWWATEVCDPVEQDTYEIDGVLVSNFEYPAWQEPPPKADAHTRYDHLGLCKGPWEVRDGGYAQKYDDQKGWIQVGMMRSGRQALHDLGLSRGHRRAA
jgi:hypothetical protein